MNGTQPCSVNHSDIKNSVFRPQGNFVLLEIIETLFYGRHPAEVKTVGKADTFLINSKILNNNSALRTAHILRLMLCS